MVMMHIDIEDSNGADPGMQVDINIPTNSIVNADLIELAQLVLTCNTVKNNPWSTHPVINGIWIDSTTTIYP